MPEPRTLHCRRLDHHDPHTWRAAKPNWRRTYHCTGRIVTAVAEQEWAEREDRAEAESEKLRHWLIGRTG